MGTHNGYSGKIWEKLPYPCTCCGLPDAWNRGCISWCVPRVYPSRVPCCRKWEIKHSFIHIATMSQIKGYLATILPMVKIPKNFYQKMINLRRITNKLVRQSQIVQSVMYSSDCYSLLVCIDLASQLGILMRHNLSSVYVWCVYFHSQSKNNLQLITICQDSSRILL